MTGSKRLYPIAIVVPLLMVHHASAGVCAAKAVPVTVCALKTDGTRQTFDDSCQAQMVRHATILHRGKCVGGGACSDINKPVCATDPETHTPSSYANLCSAEHANAPFLHNGACH